MENQHSINTILSFGAKSVNPEILEKLLIGREKTADYLFNAVKSIAEDGNNNQQLIIGQRGMGKTHLFRILFHRIQKYIIDKKLVVAYFSEEEYGVANYFDFLTRIINAIIKWNDADKEELELKIEELQETQQKAQANVAEKIIEDYIGTRPLLILAENFSDILDSIKPAEQSKLRAWLYKVNQISIIASSQSISKDFDSEDRPFYGFFNLYYLKSLDFEGSLEFLISLAKLDKREDVVEHLENKGRGQVKAIHQLVKGNHRLLVTFYEFLKTDTLAKLSSHFIKTINDLKPYYETYIRYLPAQQQKILRYVALSRKPQQGTDISKNCFIDQKSLSKQMSELSRKNLIEILVDTNDKRNKLYDILEPLLRISIEVGEHREGITSIFIDFLAIYYNENELSDRKSKFNNLLITCENFHEKLEFNYEIQAIDRALELKKTVYKDVDVDEQKIIDKIYDYFEEKDWINAEKYLNNNKDLLQKVNFYNLFGQFFSEQNRLLEAIEIYEKAENEKTINESIYVGWGIVLSNLGYTNRDGNFFELSIEKYKNALALNPNEYIPYYNIGLSLIHLGALNNDISKIYESIEIYKKAYEINTEDSKVLNNWGNSLLNLYSRNLDQNILFESFTKCFNAIKLNPKILEAYINISFGIKFGVFYYYDLTSTFKNFKNALINNLTKEERFKIYEFISSDKCFYLLENLFPIVEKDIKYLIKQESELLVSWIINILIEKRNNLNSENIAFLKTITSKYKKDFPELLIVEKYLEVFEEYVIKGNKKSLFDLPKEQRMFFKENILNA